MHDAHGTASADEHEIHLPAPTFSPATIGLGVMLLGFGVLYGVALLVLGALIVLIGLATWLIDDARAYVRAGEPADAHGHGPRPG